MDMITMKNIINKLIEEGKDNELSILIESNDDYEVFVDLGEVEEEMKSNKIDGYTTTKLVDETILVEYL